MRHAPEKTDEACPGPPPFICDFCSDPSPKWEYPAKTFTYPGYTNYGSRGNWLVCETCHLVMERDGDDALTWRAAKVFAAKMPEATPEEHYQVLKVLHRKFIEYRTGKPFPFDPTEPDDAQYRLVTAPATQAPGILCLTCGRTSYHHDDIANCYCGHCNRFHDK